MEPFFLWSPNRSPKKYSSNLTRGYQKLENRSELIWQFFGLAATKQFLKVFGNFTKISTFYAEQLFHKLPLHLLFLLRLHKGL